MDDEDVVNWKEALKVWQSSQKYIKGHRELLKALEQ